MTQAAQLSREKRERGEREREEWEESSGSIRGTDFSGFSRQEIKDGGSWAAAAAAAEPVKEAATTSAVGLRCTRLSGSLCLRGLSSVCACLLACVCTACTSAQAAPALLLDPMWLSLSLLSHPPSDATKTTAGDRFSFLDHCVCLIHYRETTAPSSPLLLLLPDCCVDLSLSRVSRTQAEGREDGRRGKGKRGEEKYLMMRFSTDEVG